MMDKYYRTNEPVTDDGYVPVLHVWVSYDKGSNPSTRGYRLSVYPVALKRYQTYTSEKGLIMQGSRRHILTVTRQSAKADENADRIACEKVDGSALYEDMMDAVCIRMSAARAEPVTVDKEKEFDPRTLPVNE